LEVVRQAGSPGGGKIKKLADREVPLSASTGKLVNCTFIRPACSELAELISNLIFRKAGSLMTDDRRKKIEISLFKQLTWLPATLSLLRQGFFYFQP